MKRFLYCLLLAGAQALGVDLFDYRVLEQRPHPRDNFVQGLEINNGVLLVGTGNYGKSRLRRYQFDSMTLIDQQALHPRLFGEGITQLGDRIYQLTWRARLGVVYRAADLRPIGRFSLPGEGWGMTNNGEQLIYSDGSDTLRYVDPRSLDVVGSLRVSEDGRPLARLNELEWVENRIWANVWQTDDIVIIHPQSGVVEGRVRLEGLLPDTLRRPDTDVLNGIAYERDSESLWVTGKHWPMLYRIETVPAVTAAPDAPGSAAHSSGARSSGARSPGGHGAGGADGGNTR